MRCILRELLKCRYSHGIVVLDSNLSGFYPNQNTEVAAGFPLLYCIIITMQEGGEGLTLRLSCPVSWTGGQSGIEFIFFKIIVSSLTIFDGSLSWDISVFFFL